MSLESCIVSIITWRGSPNPGMKLASILHFLLHSLTPAFNPLHLTMKTIEAPIITWLTLLKRSQVKV